jgi:hypothetical protein
MTTGRTVLLLLLLALLVLSPACLSTSVGQVSYDGKNLLVQVTTAGGPEEAALQVNVFRFQDFRQVEVGRWILPVRLAEGTGTYAVPLALDQGSFRLYLYVITGGDRRAGVIRDISVEGDGSAPRIGAG